MPTPTGLPKVGEIWERTIKLPPDWKPNVVRFIVLERGTGQDWSLRVHTTKGDHLWAEAYCFRRQFKYIGPAPLEVRKRLGLGLQGAIHSSLKGGSSARESPFERRKEETC